MTERGTRQVVCHGLNRKVAPAGLRIDGRSVPKCFPGNSINSLRAAFRAES